MNSDRRVPRHVGPRICLNMIVKNEAARITRCLESVAPHVHCWAITDTGSGDQTRETIRDFFGSRDLHGHLGESKFSNFRDTRNVALDMALKLRGDLAWDYLLLCDADMELVAPNGLELVAPGYQMIQRNSGMEYWNARLLKHDNPARYVLVTHEYLSTEKPLEKLHAAWFIDHADGANRPGKVARDIALLSAEVERDPNDARSWFYLGNSYRETGQYVEAFAAYEKRIALGGWEEEVYCAMLYASRCARAMEG